MRYGSVFRCLSLYLLLVVTSLPVSSGQDPMRPSISPKTVEISKQIMPSVDWRLNLIRQTDAAKIALINGKMLKVGGYVDGAQVTAIGEHQVMLKLANDRFMKLNLPSIRLRNGSK